MGNANSTNQIHSTSDGQSPFRTTLFSSSPQFRKTKRTHTDQTTSSISVSQLRARKEKKLRQCEEDPPGRNNPQLQSAGRMMCPPYESSGNCVEISSQLAGREDLKLTKKLRRRLPTLTMIENPENLWWYGWVTKRRGAVQGWGGLLSIISFLGRYVTYIACRVSTEAQEDEQLGMSDCQIHRMFNYDSLCS